MEPVEGTINPPLMLLPKIGIRSAVAWDELITPSKYPKVVPVHKLSGAHLGIQPNTHDNRQTGLFSSASPMDAAATARLDGEIESYSDSSYLQELLMRRQRRRERDEAASSESAATNVGGVEAFGGFVRVDKSCGRCMLLVEQYGGVKMFLDWILARWKEVRKHYGDSSNNQKSTITLPRLVPHFCEFIDRAKLHQFEERHTRTVERCDHGAARRVGGGVDARWPDGGVPLLPRRAPAKLPSAPPLRLPEYPEPKEEPEEIKVHDFMKRKPTVKTKKVRISTAHVTSRIGDTRPQRQQPKTAVKPAAKKRKRRRQSVVVATSDIPECKVDDIATPSPEAASEPEEAPPPPVEAVVQPQIPEPPPRIQAPVIRIPKQAPKPKPRYNRPEGAYRITRQSPKIHEALIEEPEEHSHLRLKAPKFIEKILEWTDWNKDDIQQVRRRRYKMQNRFEVPIDMSLLEGIPLDNYLREYCKPNLLKKEHYSQIFSRNKELSKATLQIENLVSALQDVFQNQLSPDCLRELIAILQAAGQSEMDRSVFYGVCALTERIIVSSRADPHNYNANYHGKDKIEEADFEVLSKRLSGLHLGPALTHVLNDVL